MLTRCPGCATTFRVTPEQLKAKHGRVRCGSCQNVFNALDTLIEAVVPQPLVQAPTWAPADEEEIIDASAPVTVAADHLPAESFAATDTQFDPLPEEPAVPLVEFPLEPRPEPPADLPVDPLFDPQLHEEEAAPRRWPWAIAIVFALLALLLQATFHYRTELAVLAPPAKPVLVALCKLSGCTVDLPSKAELLSIESSDLHPADAEQKGLLELSATLKNRAPFAQTWPHLELTLTDTSDKAIVRRIVGPSDYLPQGTVTRTGIAAHGDAAVNIFLNVNSLPASGYRLYLFYP